MIWRRWGAIANVGARRMAVLGTAMAVFCVLLAAGALPASAHDDCARLARTLTLENAKTCAACKRAVRPNRPALARAGDAEDLGALPAQAWAIAHRRRIASLWPAGRVRAHVPGAGVMLVGNVRLLN